MKTIIVAMLVLLVACGKEPPHSWQEQLCFDSIGKSSNWDYEVVSHTTYPENDVGDTKIYGKVKLQNGYGAAKTYSFSCAIDKYYKGNTPDSTYVDIY